ncbi:hypothetical protein EIP86_002032 [Pleurotus ostreatoroseus]|nr:hypothetical protein EIP86_002032 [Pleurotus ostreatoroseus]
MFARRCGASLLRNSLASLSTLSSSSATTLPRAAAFSRTFATEVSIPKSDAGDKAVVGLFKTKKPVTPGLRHFKLPLSPHLYQGRPLRDLTAPLRRKGGRNGHGRITIRFRGGGHKQRIRLVDFFRNEPGACDVVRIEYDPGRSAHIALIKNRNPKVKQAYSYIIAPEGLRAGQVVESFRKGIPEGLVPGFVDSKDVRGSQLEAPKEEGASQTTSTESLALGMLRSLTLRPGNVLPLRLIPTGTVVHNVTLKPEGRALLVRSAGTFAQVIEHERGGKYSHVRLQSGEVRKVLQDCVATIGKVSNANWQSRSLGKAGRSRWLGRRPHVRGMAMNRCDHPHGGGRGKSKGNKDPRSVWGWLTKGKRTRKPGPKGPKNSNKFVVRERPRGKEKKVLSS